MTLEIKIENVNASDAVDICTACRDAIEVLSGLEMTFTLKPEPTTIFRGEETAFTRYINSTASKGDEA